MTNLNVLGQLDLLRQLFREIVVPPAVARELASPKRKQPLRVEEIAWIRVQAPVGPSPVSRSEYLDEGEREAIHLAIELYADALLIDETYGREVARRLGLRVVGLLGALVGAKKRGLIVSVREAIERLDREANFWMSEKLVREVLVAAGESGA